MPRSPSDPTTSDPSDPSGPSSDATLRGGVDGPTVGTGGAARRGWRRPWLLALLGGAGVVVGVVLVWFQPQTLLFDTVVDEGFPVAVDAPAPAEVAVEDAEVPAEAGADDADPGPASPDDAGPDSGSADGTGVDEVGPDEDPAVDVGAEGGSTSDAGADEAGAGEDTAGGRAGRDGPVALATGSFTSRNRYTVTGTATTYTLEDGERVLRLEGFRSTNGPDLFVYLTVADERDDDPALDADAVDLGVLRGNVGDQNYVVPADVDLDRYDTVVIWCRRFSVSFGAADLA